MILIIFYPEISILLLEFRLLDVYFPWLTILTKFYMEISIDLKCHVWKCRFSGVWSWNFEGHQVNFISKFLLPWTFSIVLTSIALKISRIFIAIKCLFTLNFNYFWPLKNSLTKIFRKIWYLELTLLFFEIFIACKWQVSNSWICDSEVWSFTKLYNCGSFSGLFYFLSLKFRISNNFGLEIPILIKL